MNRPIFGSGWTGAPSRRKTRAVRVGDLWIGGSHPILIQSMTVSDTLDTDAVLREIRELAEAGCPLVRLTAPSLREAENLREIRRRLAGDGLRVPMVADIHFTPNAALVAADIVEKVRINPGNYADRKRFEIREYSDAEYDAELERVADRFRPLVLKLKQNGAALRIGTNHGSLSDRILNRYGDTPEGMVESALEFVRICEAEGYREIVLSMKSSIPSVMIAAYRLLVGRMDALGMDYPLHIGVTEAGDGLEGRMKSAIGIGALLAEGIGDTIRVSLTEDSRHEIPAARAILEAVEREASSAMQLPEREAPSAIQVPEREAGAELKGTSPQISSSPASRRRTLPWVLGSLVLGGDAPVRVEERMEERTEGAIAAPGRPRGSAGSGPVLDSEFLSLDAPKSAGREGDGWMDALERFRAGREGDGRAPGSLKPILLEWRDYRPSEIHDLEPALSLVDGVSVSLAGVDPRQRIEETPQEKLRLLARLLLGRRRPVRWRLPAASPDDCAALARSLSDLCHDEGLNTVGFVCSPGPLWIARVRAVAAALQDRGDLLFLEAPAEGPDPAILAGSVLTDGMGDAICLVPAPRPHLWPVGGRVWTEDPIHSAYTLLQGCRLRLTRAEFIACPSCGRTLFDLQSTTQRIRARTEHLTGVKIAIMGCIVNGPGEMADADFGYVGSGPGRVDLYVGKSKIRAGVSESEAADRLLDLIRENGRWLEPRA